MAESVSTSQISLLSNGNLSLENQSGDLAELLFELEFNKDVVAGWGRLNVNFSALSHANALDQATTSSLVVEEGLSKLTRRVGHVRCVHWAEPHRVLQSLGILIDYALKLVDVDLKIFLFHFLVQLVGLVLRKVVLADIEILDD